jgi:peptidoglycan-N-acetylglucosamine deacetylase
MVSDDLPEAMAAGDLPRVPVIVPPRDAERSLGFVTGRSSGASRRPLAGLRSTARRAVDGALAVAFGTIVSVDVSRPMAALTFDDGPHPVTTPRFLDLLERHGARGTFFMIGRAAQAHPELVEQVARAGHAVANHTRDHLSLPGLDERSRREQVRGGAAAIGPRCTRLFRPPYGHLDPATWWTARRLGYAVVAWSGHAFDWVDQDVDSCAQLLRAALCPGAIVLLHDAPHRSEPPGRPPREVLLRALDLVLSEDGRTYQFVTLPELLAAGRPQRRVRWRAAPAAPGTLSPPAPSD